LLLAVDLGVFAGDLGSFEEPTPAVGVALLTLLLLFWNTVV